MNNEMAIKVLKGTQPYAMDTDYYYKQAIEVAISALEQQLADRWIPVTEKLPEDRCHEYGEPKEFNVMLRGGTVATTGCINNDGEWGWMDWCNFKFNPFGVEVTHWRQLPQPPKEVQP